MIAFDSLMNWPHLCQMISHLGFRTTGFVKSGGDQKISTLDVSFLKIGLISALDCLRSTVLMVRTSFHPEATAELEASADWYAERSPQAARDFCVAVDIALASIEANPERFVRIDDRHRACSVRKFPFQIIYRHGGERIHVVAVAHAKRRPGYWHDR